MKILYIANHGRFRRSADDEGAVTFALVSLGHTVVRIEESQGHKWVDEPADLVLFHHWHDYATIARFKPPTAFWCFDLVDWPNDPTLARRCIERVHWIEKLTDLCDIGFLTDGDWVAKNWEGKLHWLPQGADERVCGPGKPLKPAPPLVFTGISRGGQGRLSWVNEVADRWGERFNHIQGRVYQRNLANLIASSQIVLAPDAPVSDRYFSNRAVMALGFQAFLIHPWTAGLAAMYRPDEEIVFYRDRLEMHRLIAFWLRPEQAERRAQIAAAGFQRTIRDHTYRHRCKRLLEIVKEQLG